MKHSVDELFDIVYRYYPRRMERQDPRYEQSDEYQRLSAARRQAGADAGPWRTMLTQLQRQFPSDNVVNRSLHLPIGSQDAAYSGHISVPSSPGERAHSIGFLVSFLAPYYVVYSSRFLGDATKEEHPAQATRFRITIPWDEEADVPGTPHVEDWQPSTPARRVIRFDFSVDEQPYAAWIAREVEATWGGYQPMPPEIGKLVVPDVATDLPGLGEATLYDCLFSDDW